jgi:FKBP-type peptidyl-prolyl cis-trans isomerase (trigger factor)
MKNKKLTLESFKSLIKKIIKEETAPALKGDTSNLINNFKKLNIPGFDPGKITTTIMLVKQNKVLNTAANKVLADIMTAMIKTSDDALLTKIFSNLKNIETPNPE